MYCATSRLFAVPTDAMRIGDFSELKDAQGRLMTLYDPNTTDPKTLELPFGSWTLDRLATYLHEQRGIQFRRPVVLGKRFALVVVPLRQNLPAQVVA